MGSVSCIDFHHPYEPYDIQVELMQCVYGLLTEGKKFAILESPTGTGKTLSLICSVVTWLRDNKADLIAGLDSGKTTSGGNDGDANEDDSEDDEPDWVNDAFEKSVLESKMQGLQDYEKRLEKLQPKLLTREFLGQERKKRRMYNLNHAESSNDDAVFLPEPYSSDSEDAVAEQSDAHQLRDEVSALLAKFDSKDRHDDCPSTSDTLNPVKIFYASRTHSQLNQFASQLRLPKFPSSFQKYNVLKERVKYLPLASRRQLCVNPAVNRLKSVEAINDACAELLKSKEGCTFYKPTQVRMNDESIREFQDQTFFSIHDIEDLAEIGSKLHVCPYYASRSALKSAEIITLPYQYLLSENTRESLSIDLTSSIVIIDEAHNLLESINAIHSADISLGELGYCMEGLSSYFKKFKTRLNPGNRVNLMKLMKLIETLMHFIRRTFKKAGQEIDPNNIFEDSNADILNVYKINKYIKKSKIAFKIDSYIQSLCMEKEIDDKGIGKGGSNGSASSQPLLFKVVSFISCLANPASEGRFFFEKGSSIKYMLLEPGRPFQSILEKARCVILAGGTMQPISDIMDNLLSKSTSENVEVFACDHVIPDDNLKSYIINDSRFEFTFDKRKNTQMIEDLMQFYHELSQTVPLSGGIVGFFPSYQYLEFVIREWKRTGMYGRLNSVREIFFEARGGKDPLSDYSDRVREGKGAILFAVVGGKLSEGINFQDNLCRAVVMTGLPFPNVFSGELLVKKKHLEQKIISRGNSREDANKATREFYETICMKAVNQSIGRAIRHANDYALIYLLDKRFQNINIKNKLSHWVRRRIQPQDNLSAIMASTRNFFSQNNRSA